MIRKWNDDGWRRRFALIPFILNNGPERTLVWLEWYWARFAGLYTEVSLADPRNPASGIEARRAETGTGSVHESAAPKADAQGGAS